MELFIIPKYSMVQPLDKYFNFALYQTCGQLSMLGWKLNHVRKWAPADVMIEMPVLAAVPQAAALL